MINKKRVLVLLGIAVLVVAALIVLSVLNNRRFRLVDSSPANNVFPTSTSELAFVFSKKLDATKTTKDIVMFEPVMNFKFTIDDQTLKITLAAAPTQDFTLSIDEVTAESGEIIQISRSYKVEYVAYKNLSDYEKNRQISQSDNYVSTYPIISQLPIRTNIYTITYQLPADYSPLSDNPSPLILNIAILDENANYDTTTQITQDVETELRNRGFKPEDYIISTGLEAPL